MNQQTVSWTAFGTGLTTFMGIAGEVITEHTTWHELTTPWGFVHLVGLGAAFVLMIGGALGIQLPRSPGAHVDRVSDPAPPTQTKPAVSPPDAPDPAAPPPTKEP